MKKIIFVIILLVSMVAQAKTADVVAEKTATGVATVYEDGRNVVKTIYQDAKDVSPAVKKAFESLAGEMKVTTDYLWNILVNQQKVYSWGLLILTLASISNWCLLYYRNFSEKARNKMVKVVVSSTTERNPDYDNAYGGQTDPRKKYKMADEIVELPMGDTDRSNALLILHIIICLTMSSFSAYYFSTMLTGFINPEYGALKTITEVVSHLK